MMRVLDWRSRLIEWGVQQIGKPFKWGQTDCAMLVRRALEECFGRDLVPHVPQWSDRRRAQRTLKKYGSWRSMLLSLGAEERPINFARTGDVIWMDEPTEPVGGEAYGVWLDAACLVSSDEGVYLVSSRDMPQTAVALSLWEVPDEH